MKSDIERCAEYQKFKKFDAAFRVGDLTALRAVLDDPDSVPNRLMPREIGPCLQYAINHSPLPFIRTLLEIGAAVELLLEAGADPRLRTRIDDCETPRDIAETAGLREIAELLAAHEARMEK